MTLQEIIAEAQKIVADLQALEAVPVTSDPVVTVETITESGVKEDFTPESTA